MHVDPRFDAQTVEQIQHVLGSDIAGGAFGVGTTAETGHRAVKSRDAAFERRIDIGHRLAVSVVEMSGETMDGDVPGDGLNHRAGLAGGAGADSVADGLL